MRSLQFPVAAINSEEDLCTGLAECLRSELKVYHIDVHVAFPPTISSPDLDEENEVRPDITRKIEETESYSPPEAVALAIVRGVWKCRLLFDRLLRPRLQACLPYRRRERDVPYYDGLHG